VFTFHVKLPIFVARQWIRHRTARLNEISGRYSVMKSEFYLPSTTDIAFQSDNNKQGRATTKVPPKIQKQVLAILEKYQKQLYGKYEELLEINIARELARINLPLSLYTEWYWQIDLHNLFRFLSLRLDQHAQMEIRAYAEVIHTIGRKVCPVAFDAFDEHILSGVRFSKSEMAAVRNRIKGKPDGLDEKAAARLLAKLGIS
jgi:thymidylate synthase (FAD)